MERNQWGIVKKGAKKDDVIQGCFVKDFDAEGETWYDLVQVSARHWTRSVH
jgi:hypothetical protein